MPLVYPPNFEGVGLTYEFVNVYSLESGDPVEDGVSLHSFRGSESSFEVTPAQFMFHFELVDNLRLKICGFVNTSQNDVVSIINNPGKTYYRGYAGYIRENDGCFLLFKCRMALNGTFSAPIYFRVFLEMGVTFSGLGTSIDWENIPVSAYFDLGQSEN